MKRILSLWLTMLATTALWAAFTPAAFTVSSEGKQVYFSQGNLQCTGVTSGTSTWSFAENQYDMLGESNLSGSSLADKIDLFGWSGSTGTAKWGIGTYQNNDYYKGDFVDWGQNTIGSYASDDYRTLTNAEWLYLLNTRTNAESKKGVARIQISDTEYANGLILLPDSWTCPKDVTFKNGFATTSGAQYYADYQTFTLTEWQKLEAAGAVFLPASGYRQGDVSGVQFSALYWSATKYSSYEAYYLYFNATKAITTENIRYRGNAVRLVQDTKYTISIAQPKHGTIAANKEACAEGRTVTLTLSPDAYYAPKTVTVFQGETPVATTAVAGTTYQYTFTMPAGAVTVSATCEKVAPVFTPAAFTVDYNKQVYFASGNLQCSGLTTKDTTWLFAEYQTDYLGTDNVTEGTISYNNRGCESKTGTALADKIDLFGWSANNETAPWGISTTQSNADHAGDFVDWGKNIGDGTTYRTLSADEWRYLLYYRTNANNLKGVAHILLNGDGSKFANGFIFLPDNWACPDGVTFKSGFGSSDNAQSFADYQTLTFAEWQKLEAAGAVFLPAAGDRRGTEAYIIRTNGDYWSTSYKTADGAYYLYFSAVKSDINHLNRHTGRSVRLVQDIKYPVTLTTTEHGTITADKMEAISGETITLTITPDAYYALKTITVTYGEGETVTVTSDYTFTMPAGEVTITAEFEKLSSAFTPVAFTVSESGKQVYFSQGNLQCTGVTSGDYKWSFADYQTDMLGDRATASK